MICYHYALLHILHMITHITHHYALILILRNSTHHALLAGPPPILPFPLPWQLRQPISGCLEPEAVAGSSTAAAVAYASAVATHITQITH